MPLILRTCFNHLPVHRQSLSLLHCPVKQRYGTSEPHQSSQLPFTCEEGIREASTGTERRTFFTFTLQKKVLLLFRQLHTEAGTISNIDTFGALLINVPTTAIFLLHYAEHSNVFFCVYCFSRSDDCFEHGSVLATCLLTCN